MKKYYVVSIAWLSLTLGSSAMARAVVSESFTNPSTAPTVVNLDGGVMVGGGQALPGIEVGLSGRLSDRVPVYFGGEIGAFIQPQAPSYAVFPLLPTVFTQFEVARGIRPLLGVMGGPVISTGGGYSSVRFGLLARPGVNFDLARRASLNVEARFGVIGSTTVFLPQVGAIFAM